ncbi:MAG: glutamate-1-semialdehyde 2,1-aminomutase [Elusimicrobia bacterium]|nr:glutamate-1-semialdehyde 2,1-aminomutase [Elusimicrobiota bacterium]
MTTSDRRSEALFRRAQRVLVGGVNSPVRAFKAVGGVPRWIARGRGSALWDVDGHRYVDYCGSWGPLILGHAHPAVLKAVRSALTRGASFGASSEPELRLAELICEALPSVEQIRFVSSGTESVMSAIRLARAATQRDIIVKFAGCYHGHVDSLLVQVGSGALTLGVPSSAGVPHAVTQATRVLPYNDLTAAGQLFQKEGDRIAAVIVEPVAANMGVVPPQPGFLEELRALTTRHGALLIFDEVITGFRLGFGGAQTQYRLAPDLTCLGKIIGGGFPVGAYGGHRTLMKWVAPLGPVYQAGTLSGNPIAMSAGLATLTLLQRRAGYARLEQLTRRLVEGVRTAAWSHGVPIRMNSVASFFTVFFTQEPVVDERTARRADARRYARFFQGMLKRGVYFPPSQFEAAFVSVAHTEQDIDRTIEAARLTFAELGTGRG